MLVEVFLDPDKDLLGEGSPIILTQFNISKSIKDSILVKFGECGLGSSLGSFKCLTCRVAVKYVNPDTKLCTSREDYTDLLDVSRSIRGCKDAALVWVKHTRRRD